MGQTAEKLARLCNISRKKQDDFALRSQNRAEEAQKCGYFLEESFTLFTPPLFTPVTEDDGIRKGQTIQSLEKLKPAFDKQAGTVTAGTSSQITDGAISQGLLLAVLTQASWDLVPYLLQQNFLKEQNTT
jgi:acetyl-CoA acetyltransferase